MDAMAFGMGACCLQVTFQARDLDESRNLYDQLAILSPLMLALTANAPIWRGRMADTDTRWDVIAASVDCRTPAERGTSATEPAPSWMLSENASFSAGGGVRPIAKSRYSSIDCYLSDSPAMVMNDDFYNDVPVPIDAEAFRTLVDAGANSEGEILCYLCVCVCVCVCECVRISVSLRRHFVFNVPPSGVDKILARHVAHLFIRDPLVIFKEKVCHHFNFLACT